MRTPLVLLLLAVACAGAKAQAWKPGQFGELVAGKSTRADVIRVLGAADPGKGARVETYKYAAKGDLGGDVLVEVNRTTGVVESITVQFSPNVTRTQAYKKYGRDYKEVNYSVVNCPQNGATPLVYRNPKGGVELLEYPQKGLVLWPNQYGFDIAAAVYLARPLPSKKPACGK